MKRSARIKQIPELNNKRSETATVQLSSTRIYPIYTHKSTHKSFLCLVCGVPRTITIFLLIIIFIIL